MLAYWPFGGVSVWKASISEGSPRIYSKRRVIWIVLLQEIPVEAELPANLLVQANLWGPPGFQIGDNPSYRFAIFVNICN